MKILVIDDSEDDRLLYRRSLTKNKDDTYDIAEAEDGESGMTLIHETPPDCILLDYSLPGRNGVEVLKRIRAVYPFIPVVMMTGQGNESVAVNAIQEGAQNYITKSNITPESIHRVTRVAIEHCALQKRIHEQRTALEIFTRALAHDLKEPVRTIKSFLGLMASGETFSERGKGYFAFIQQAADRMITLIDTVYFYTRLDGSPQHPTQEACDVNQVLAEARENIRQLTEERRATITSDKLPHVHANRMQLLQVLQNLMVNAIRHCESEPVIHVQAVEGLNHWLFRVTDNGPGIQEEHPGQIFQPFKRMSRQKEQGLGLGLAICKKIVESYGGKIWYESAPEKGATFLFTLPKIASDAVPERQVADPKSINGNGAHHNLASLLLVEDNEADIQLAKILLIEKSKLKCNLLVAHDGFEALTMLRAEAEKTGAIDLVLLDINMPGMDGFDLLEKMQGDKLLSSVPVVMCTTSGYDKDMEKAQELGAIGYINKPAELGKLQPILDQATNLRLCREKDGYALLRAA